MGSDATASVSYGIIIPQPKVLKLLRKLQTSSSSSTSTKDFDYSSASCLEELLGKHLHPDEEEEEIFQMDFCTRGDGDHDGMVVLYKWIDPERITVWGFGSQSPLTFILFYILTTIRFTPEFQHFKLSDLAEDEEVKEADAAFKRLGEDPLFKKLKIEVEPGWLLGCNMSC